MSQFRRWINILSEEMEETPPYNSLADAGKLYKPGNTEIWYAKEKYSNVMKQGYKALVHKKMLPNENTMFKTHSMIGTIKENDPESVFSLMQAEAWDPENKSRNMLRHVGVGHASMSVGDIIVTDEKMYIVDSDDFREI